jgi:hypothetical protein
MKDIIEILKSHFKITQIIIENFTILDTDLTIVMKIHSDDFGDKVITFESASRININSEYYTCSDRSSITIEDLSSLQMEGITYKIAISEDVMTFYCKNIKLS